MLETPWQRKWLDLEVTHDDVQKMATLIQWFAHKFYHGDTSAATQLVISGPPGCGKSRCLQRVAEWTRLFPFPRVSKTSTGLEFVYWPEFAVELEKKNDSRMIDLINADLLILDDIGSEKDDWKTAANYLCNLLSRREGKFNLISTNILSCHWAEKFDERINDRLLRRSRVIDLASVPSFSIWKIEQAEYWI